jgi:hypothetical protein
VLPLLLVLVVTQLPCAGAAEPSAVCSCKQGVASACAALAPEKAAEIEQALRVLKAAEEAQQQSAGTASSTVEESSSAPEPPECKGQQHHIISNPIAKALERHPTLMGVYKPRDARFVTRAIDEAAHCGYQDWHRKVDAEVINWLETHRAATARQFEEFLHSIYNRPDMLARFPHGF